MGGEAMRTAATRPRSATRQAAMLEAVEAVFAEHGFSGATTEEMARRAKASKTTLYRLFGDKPEMFRRALQARLGTEIPAPAHALGSPAAALREAARAILRTTTDPRTAALMRVAAAEAVRFPELQAILAESLAHRALAGYLARCRTRGLMAFDDADAAAALFVAVVQGSWMVRALYGLLAPVPAAALEAQVEAAVRGFLAAVAPAASPAP